MGSNFPAAHRNFRRRGRRKGQYRINRRGPDGESTPRPRATVRRTRRRGRARGRRRHPIRKRANVRRCVVGVNLVHPRGQFVARGAAYHCPGRVRHQCGRRNMKRRRNVFPVERRHLVIRNGLREGRDGSMAWRRTSQVTRGYLNTPPNVAPCVGVRRDRREAWRTNDRRRVGRHIFNL